MKRAPALVIGVAAAAAVALVVVGAQVTFNRVRQTAPSVSASGTAECDDTVRPTAELPTALQANGINRAVGERDIWFIAPAEGTWSSSVTESSDGSFMTKRPLWTTSTRLPAITVRKTSDGTRGSASLSATGDGLPGPIPMTLRLPSRGCWDITAKTDKGQAEIFIKF